MAFINHKQCHVPLQPALSKVCHQLLFWENRWNFWVLLKPILVLFSINKAWEREMFLLELDMRNAGFIEHKDILQSQEIKERHSPQKLNWNSWAGKKAMKRLKMGTNQHEKSITNKLLINDNSVIYGHEFLCLLKCGNSEKFWNCVVGWAWGVNKAVLFSSTKNNVRVWFITFFGSRGRWAEPTETWNILELGSVYPGHVGSSQSKNFHAGHAELSQLAMGYTWWVPGMDGAVLCHSHHPGIPGTRHRKLLEVTWIPHQPNIPPGTVWACWDGKILSQPSTCARAGPKGRLGFPPGVLAGFGTLFYLSTGQEVQGKGWTPIPMCMEPKEFWQMGDGSVSNSREHIYPEEMLIYPGKHLLVWSSLKTLDWLCLGEIKPQVQ